MPQRSGRAISAATRGDPWSLRLGGFVTAQDFLDKVSEKESGAAAKPASKRRAPRVGEPLRRVDRAAAKHPAKPVPKPRAEKRRRVDDPAPAAAPAYEEAQSFSDEGDGAGDPFDLYFSYQSSCKCIWGEKVFVNADHRNKMNPDQPDKWCNNYALAVLRKGLTAPRKRYHLAQRQ